MKLIKVYILLGQSNMLGYGRIGIEPDETGQEGSLSHAVKEKGLYPYLIDEAGNWTDTRQDVNAFKASNNVTWGSNVSAEISTFTTQKVVPFFKRQNTYPPTSATGGYSRWHFRLIQIWI